MYQVGDLIIYGAEGVCEVVSIGPLAIRGAQKGIEYYTLSPLYRDGTIFIPVNTTVFTRPIISKEEAEDLIDQIPQVPEEVYENSNPRMLNEHYQMYLKSHDCLDLVRLIRAIYAKGRNIAEKGRHLGQVDERTIKRAEDMLHSELAAALNIPMDQVKDYIISRIESVEKA